MTVTAKLVETGPYKLLALDGGGIRGALSIEVLAAIERILRERSGNPGLVLTDYFGCIAGTSTGAINRRSYDESPFRLRGYASDM